MSFFEQCRQCSVMVDGGSGVLFQPMTEEYSYILTAKHNLYDNQNNPKLATDIHFTRSPEGTSENIIEKYEHTTLDIAILKIEKIDFTSPYKQWEQVNNGDEFKFYGYPENRRQQTEEIKYFNLKVGDMSGQEIVAENDSYYAQSDVSGCSGGGVFRQDGENFILVGIECRMDAESAEDENNSRLRFISINAFDKIIEDNNGVLQPLYPPFLNNFSSLLDNIFFLNGMEEAEKRLTQDRLRLIAEDLSKKIKPIDIKNRYNILESSYDKKCYSNKELWSMYLEFIVISVFLDMYSPLGIEAIRDINKKRKFLFLKSTNWKENKEEILTSDFSSLEKNATVIVACDGDRTPTSCHIKSSTLENIGHGILPEKFNIAYGMNPYHDFTFKHIHAIQKQMIDDCDNSDTVFNGATATNIEEIIKDEINKVFG
ncbi:ABC-three component system protein [Sulfurovum sp. NBC37-1]|uniref:ABC-three component system protein n=1 Tax=Sulfurovum sp. (strain NBC37-1) TaxID=387093 RepID=UPI0001587866|nr:ABC-three component system protein [Sulfurovum sp. NBC37-1]BAF71689.1 conserved hypothetical protein [Sulfurovum sp. NBC37-1]